MYVWKTFRDETNTEKEKPLIYVHKRYIIEKKPVFGDGHRIVDNVPDGESRGGGGASGVGVSGAISFGCRCFRSNKRCSESVQQGSAGTR